MSAEAVRRPRAMAALLLIAVFLAGIAVGFTLHRVIRPRPRIMATLSADMSGVLEKLDLSAEQRARVDSIMQRRAPATEIMMGEVTERLRSISDSLDRELRTILTPAQRQRLDSLRSGRLIMIKRKTGPHGTTRVDTVFPGRDSSER